MALNMHRGFRIYYDPTFLPTRDLDWVYVHDDYDGAPDANDNRHGRAASYAECIREIDALLDDEETA